MKKKINSIFVALFFNALFSFSLMGQNQVFKEAFLSKKSVVLYNLKDPKTTKKTLSALHQNLSSLGFDVVNYLDSINMFISDEVTKNLTAYFNEREIKNIIFYSQKEESLSFFLPKNILTLNKKPEFIIKGDSVFFLLKKTIIKNKITQKNFLLSPYPEIINRINTKKTNQIINKPSLKKDKIGLVGLAYGDTPKNILQVEKKEDYRFYFSNGINYIISFYRGTNNFLRNTFGIKELDKHPNEKTLVLVLEHTATRNKFFYYKEGVKDKKTLLLNFFKN